MAMNPQNGGGDEFYRPLAEINVTPLVDVMLVLLIIFMVTAPLLATGMKVNLPQAKSAQPLNPKEPIVVSIAKDGGLAIGPDQIASEQLVDLVRIRLGGDPTQVVHLRGDKDASYGQVIQVMDTLIANGITHLAMVTDRHAKTDAVRPLP